jgi:hypothetical protein
MLRTLVVIAAWGLLQVPAKAQAEEPDIASGREVRVVERFSIRSEAISGSVTTSPQWIEVPSSCTYRTHTVTVLARHPEVEARSRPYTRYKDVVKRGQSGQVIGVQLFLFATGIVHNTASEMTVEFTLVATCPAES